MPEAVSFIQQLSLDDTLSGPMPVEPAERIEQIDILRGLALFGVLAINLLNEFRISIFQQFVSSPAPTGAVNRWIETYLPLFIEMKAFALFSLLFGIGLAIQFERSSARGPALPLLTRRLLALLLIGIIHLTLIWNGDILTEYAIAGFIALLFLFTSKMWLGVFSLLFASAYVILPYLNLPLPSLNPAWIHAHLSQANVVYKHGTFRQILSFEFHELPELLPLHIYVLPRTVALFLFGAFSWRSGVVKRLGSHLSLLAGVAFFCLLVGIPLIILTSRLAPSWRLILGRGSDALSMIGEMALAIGYAGTILCAATTKWGERLLGWAAPLGRMAFTNYLLQSVIFSAVFFGWGLGWYGMSAGPALLIGIIVYVVQVFVSAAWLRRYRFGPVEWLWRTMMYGYMQPLKRRHQ